MCVCNYVFTHVAMTTAVKAGQHKDLIGLPPVICVVTWWYCCGGCAAAENGSGSNIVAF